MTRFLHTILPLPECCGQQMHLCGNLSLHTLAYLCRQCHQEVHVTAAFVEDARDCPDTGSATRRSGPMRLGITLTGADAQTPLADLVALAEAGAEIGLLYTFSPDGRHRYPSLMWLREAARALRDRCALHVCGGRARAELCNGRIEWLADMVGRIQVNGDVSPIVLQWLCDHFFDRAIITQHNDRNARLLDADAPNHTILVDASGGRGLLPESWSRPVTRKPVGFAGGLGPENLREELPKIIAAATRGAWVDMEGKLRDEDDWFDVYKAWKSLEVWKAVTKE